MTFDVFPAKRRQVGKAIGGYRRSLAFERRDSMFQIDGIPQDDRGNNQIEPAGLILFPGPVANRASSVEENCPSQGVSRLAFIQPEMNPPPEFWTLNPLQCEECPLDPAKFA